VSNLFFHFFSVYSELTTSSSISGKPEWHFSKWDLARRSEAFQLSPFQIFHSLRRFDSLVDTFSQARRHSNFAAADRSICLLIPSGKLPALDLISDYCVAGRGGLFRVRVSYRLICQVMPPITCGPMLAFPSDRLRLAARAPCTKNIKLSLMMSKES
jgi:hypothetical protein